MLFRSLQPAVRAISRGAKAQLEEPTTCAVDKRFDAKFLGETLQFTFRRGALDQIDEVNRDPTLRKEALSLARGRVFFRAEYLDRHLSPADAATGGVTGA